ncbi:MAG: 2-amino-4-hydroxy-6-hydroxymethyldihydropteridine diphosphokinase [Candidatus Syntrophosphaera sp.]
MIAYLCLGSNLNEPREQVRKAAELLRAEGGIHVRRESSLIRTKAYGKKDQPDFYNQVLEIETQYEPHELLHALMDIERRMGRVRKEKWGPRVIDLDILFYGDAVLETDQLILPHPDLHNRGFVLDLLAELSPELTHPVLRKSVSELKNLLHMNGESRMKDLSAIILAAGKGTRMRSERAKVTFPVAGKTMIQRVVDTALKLNCARIYVVVGHKKEAVAGCLAEDDRLEFVEQAEQLGTGHAVMMAEPVFQDKGRDAFVLSGDVPLLSGKTLEKMHREHLESGAACTVLTAWMEDPGRYGRIIRDAANQMTGIVESRDATPEQLAIREWNTGIYCFKAGALFGALEKISNANNQKEYYLTDVISVRHEQGEKLATVKLKDPIEVAGVNSQEQLAELEDLYVDGIRRRWLNSGVVIHNPATVYIDDDVVLEPDVEIGQNCVLKGKTTICRDSCLGPGCYVQNSYLSDSCVLEGHNILVNAHIPDTHIVKFGEKVIEELDYE